MNGCYGCFSVQDATQGPKNEVSQGKLVADIAADCGIQHLVYSSVCAANKNTDIPHFESKWQIEQYIQSRQLPCTVLRPVFFMDNFSAYQKDSILNDGRISLPIDPDTTLQMIACCDIGAAAATCFADPQNCGEEFDLAGDELTLPQAARQIGQCIGRTVTYVQSDIEEIRSQSEEMATMYEWFNNVGYDVNISSLRKTFPKLQNFQTWLKQSEWSKVRVPTGR